MNLFYAHDKQYAAERDVRDWTRLVSLVANHQTNRGARLLVAPRRSGKTWMLAALAQQLQPHGSTQYLDLQKPANERWTTRAIDARFVLLDEPGRWMANGEKEFNRRRAGKLLARCDELHQADKRVLVALSPRELEFLLEWGDPQLRQNVVPLWPLTAAESSRMAGRGGNDWGDELLQRLPEHWRRNPFLLEVVLESAELHPDLRANLPQLLDAARDVAISGHQYLDSVWQEGLSEPQRVQLRQVARREASTLDAESPWLAECGLVVGNRPDRQIGDPIVLTHLPPALRIHHLSDIHEGGRSARVGGGRVPGAIGGAVQGATGANRLVRDAYLDFLESHPAERPHLVVISGDLAERGDRGLYEKVNEWLGRLRKLLAEHPDLRADDQRILLVGGNHDVDWKNTTGEHGARQRHQPFADAFADYPRPRLEKPPEARPLTTVKFPLAQVAFCLLGSSEVGGETETSDAFRRIVGELEKLREEAGRLIERQQWAESEKFLNDLSRVDPGLVNHRDIARVSGTRLHAPVRIAVLHHPISPLPYAEASYFSGTVNAGPLKQALISGGYCLVLHGHMHTAWFAEERWPMQGPPGQPDWTLRIASAASLGTEEKDEKNGFNEILVMREGDDCCLKVWQRRFDTNWPASPALGPFRPGEPGGVTSQRTA